MSQSDATDLLCSSRREELSLDEQRRLRESIQYSLEVRIMSEILPELERESRVRPGDDLLLARINARALSALRPRAAPVRAPAKRRTVMLLVAAAVLLMAGLASAWFGGARLQRALEPPPLGSAAPKPALKPKPPLKPKPIGSNVAVVPVEPPTPPAPEAPTEPNPTTACEATPHGCETSPRELKADPPDKASELFARANRLRRQGRALEAAAAYERLLTLYPSSREVGPTRLALGKFLQGKQPERALAQFRALAAGGGALRAEALWGISEVATALGQRSASEQALEDLLREFPDSPYAEVARARVSR
ncbi:MAG TPA: tetratricopeptide repeat protein [Polyangiaceae bacterium]|nr:tetratricopeptide repeat protein [Polyangiaceae bacterium]